MPVIAAHALSREFRVARKGERRGLIRRAEDALRAVDAVSFTIEEGELVGYIGPNGAGKSTTVKMLAGILVPTSGSVTVLGRVPHRQRKENAREIGVVFGQRSQLWWDLPTVDSFELLRRMYGVNAEAYARVMKSFQEVLALDDFLHVPVRQLSLGQRMRADLAVALLHDPKVIFLDEPTIGLDVVAKKQVREFIRRVRRERGVTVLLTTHDMKDIEEICDRIIMIDHGRLVLDTSVTSLRRTLGGAHTLIVSFEKEPESIDIPGVQVASREAQRWVLRFDRQRISAADLISRVSALGAVSDISLREPDIEDIVRNIYTGAIKL
jgi:ABC-2 type transport system ATP-binding protein